MKYSSWSVIIDDIVFPDGRTAMGVLGGGGVYAVAGMRPWSADVGIMANVAESFDAAILGGLDVALDGLYRGRRSTPRAWQLFETDGHRTQIPRIPDAEWQAQLAWPADLVERLAALGVRAVHELTRGLPGNPETLAAIKAAGVRISLEPVIEEGMSAAQRDVVLECLPYVEIFSPGEQELRVLMGDVPPAEALRRLAARGPELVALRRGAAGSLLYHRQGDLLLRVPAAPANVVDVTGAGNAYAGGMLVAWCETGDPRLAAASAAVSAALVIEQIGPPTFTPDLLAEAEQRRAAVLARLRETGSDDD